MRDSIQQVDKKKNTKTVQTDNQHAEPIEPTDAGRIPEKRTIQDTT